MATSSSEAIAPPPPPPPPPLLNNDNTNTSTLTNGSASSQVQTTNSGAPTTSTDGTKPWQRAWSVDEMRKGATNWSLASDAGLLLYLQEFSQNMLSQTHSMEQKVDGLVHETKGISAKVHNTFNSFLMLSNTQFIENRVYDEEERKDEEEKIAGAEAQEKEKSREELETEVIPKINEAIQSGLAVLDSAFVTVEITPEQISDDEDEGTLPGNLKPEPILELTDVYAHRKLPCFIGTPEFQKDDFVGLAESSSEDEEDGSEKEASADSEEEKSTEDEETSDSETVSGSQSGSEGSSTATESENEKEFVAKKKARKESSQAESDDELFSAGGTEKPAKSKQIEEEEDGDESDEESDESMEKPQKAGVAMDFSAELAAKLGVKAKKPVYDSDDKGDNEEDWGKSERRESKATNDDLFTASVDTTTSVSSKGSKRREKKHKKSKSRSGSHASHDSGKSSALTAGNVANDLETSQRLEDDEDNLFTSSIDTTSSAVSKGSRTKHKHKKKAGRSDSQLSNASSKSGQKEKKTNNMEENNLFGGSPEGDLFDEDMSSPFSKKGGRFSGGGGLFDDVMEDGDEATKSEALDKNISKSSHEPDESDEEIVKPKPRTSSGKKLPAGAVAIFGDHGPFGVPVQTHDQHVAKPSPPEKKEEKASGGGLFSDEGEDIFTSSQSSSIISNKPPVATKATKSVDLFGSGDEGDDDDSLFGAKPAKKTEVKAEPPKKKIPAGAVSIFGSGSPPPLFSTLDTEPPGPEVQPDSAPSNVMATKEASGLFDDEDDRTSSFNSERAAVSNTAATAAPAVKTKRKTNQISLFDDNEDGDDEGDDLFASIAPSKPVISTKSEISSKPDQSTNAKTTNVPKPVAKPTTISLFDDDEEKDGEEDIFSIKPTSKPQPAEVKASEVKSLSTPSPALFASDEDPLFSGEKPKANEKTAKVGVDSVDNKPAVKTTKQESSVLDDDDDDLFTEPKPKASAAEAVMTEPSKEKTKEEPKDLFDVDSDVDEKDEPDGVKPTPSRKILPGAVPMFGGVDIFAGQKPGKTTKAAPSGDSLFADDEDDLFASTPVPKPIPAVAPRAKPRKPPVEVPQQTTSSPLGEGDVPDQSSPVVSSKNKNTNVGKLQKTLAFNPAAMLPSAAPPPKKQETTIEPIVARKPIIFNPATMLPGAAPPPRQQESAAEATFDKPATVKTLDSSGKDRARVRGKRRPPTRQARQKAAKESIDDTSLFGSDLTGSSASYEPLIGDKGGQTSLFSDSGDLFSSSSFKAPAKKQVPHAKQSHSSKFDPLFIHSMSASALPSFEDSIDGPLTQPPEAENRKGSSTNTKTQTEKTIKDPLVDNPLKDDLFNTSTESENSFFPKQKVDNRASNNEQEAKQMSKSLFDEESKDDLFSLSNESESSILPKTKVVQENLPGPKITNTESLVDKKSPDDLFRQSTENNIISQKAKPPEEISWTKTQESKTDSLFESKQQDDDIFGDSVESKKSSSKKTKVIEDDDDDEDELFKPSRPLFSPPPLDFDGEITASGDFAAETKSKPVDDIFNDDDDDIFAPKTSKKQPSESKTEKGKEKVDKAVGKKEDVQAKTNEVKTTSEVKTTTAMDDLFADTGSIFDDLPKKSKEKKKKKVTTSSKEENIFGDTKGEVASEDASSSKTTKKTKGKKKGKSKASIFDENSPSIFDDPLNATSK